MPKFIDTHPMKPFTADQLNKLQKAPPDRAGRGQDDRGIGRVHGRRRSSNCMIAAAVSSIDRRDTSITGHSCSP